MNVDFKNSFVEQKIEVNTCSICRDPLVPRDVKKIATICSHVFHKQCLEKWVSRNPSKPKCPLCNTIQPDAWVKEYFINIYNYNLRMEVLQNNNDFISVASSDTHKLCIIL